MPSVGTEGRWIRKLSFEFATGERKQATENAPARLDQCAQERRPQCMLHTLPERESGRDGNVNGEEARKANTAHWA